MDTQGLFVICSGLGEQLQDDCGALIGYTPTEYCLGSTEISASRPSAATRRVQTDLQVEHCGPRSRTHQRISPDRSQFGDQCRDVLQHELDPAHKDGHVADASTALADNIENEKGNTGDREGADIHISHRQEDETHDELIDLED